jgi:RNA polymerase sigma-70 factor (ECF subfamily)
MGVLMGAHHRRAVADEVLVRHLFEEHGKAVLAYATRLTGDPGSAENVFQETLVWAWHHSASFAEGKCATRVRLFNAVGAFAAGKRPSSAAQPEHASRRPGGRRSWWRGADTTQGVVQGELT